MVQFDLATKYQSTAGAPPRATGIEYSDGRKLDHGTEING